MADIQSFSAEVVKVRLGLDLRPVAGDRFRSLNDGVGGKARGRKRDRVSVRLGADGLRLLAEVDHLEVLAGLRTVEQLDPDVHRLVGLIRRAGGVDDGDIKNSRVVKADSFQRDGGAGETALIRFAAQLPGLQLRPGGDAAGPVVSNCNFICLAVGGVYGLL